jgi:hypothetical protein
VQTEGARLHTFLLTQEPAADTDMAYVLPSTSAAPLITRKLVVREALSSPPPSPTGRSSEELVLRHTAAPSLRVILGETVQSKVPFVKRNTIKSMRTCNFLEIGS